MTFPSERFGNLAARILLSVLLSLLLWMYPLFLLTLAVGVGAVLVWLVVVAAHVNWHLAIAAVIPLCLHLAALAQLLMAYGLVRELPKSSGDDELPLPRSQLKPLYSLVKRVAGARHVGMPDEIRLAADTVAHVYEDDGGREILVLGGFALASFSEETLEGIIAHELCHFAAGDTRQSRRSSASLSNLATSRPGGSAVSVLDTWPQKRTF